jgi:hypothetical protein
MITYLLADTLAYDRKHYGSKQDYHTLAAHVAMVDCVCGEQW